MIHLLDPEQMLVLLQQTSQWQRFSHAASTNDVATVAIRAMVEFRFRLNYRPKGTF
jgi:hypothetical protein